MIKSTGTEATPIKETEPSRRLSTSSLPVKSPDTVRKSYPKRENRKPPGRLMDMFEPALFSKPDRMKKIDSNKMMGGKQSISRSDSQEKLSPTTPTKKSSVDNVKYIIKQESWKDNVNSQEFVAETSEMSMATPPAETDSKDELELYLSRTEGSALTSFSDLQGLIGGEKIAIAEEEKKSEMGTMRKLFGPQKIMKRSPGGAKKEGRKKSRMAKRDALLKKRKKGTKLSLKGKQKKSIQEEKDVNLSDSEDSDESGDQDDSDDSWGSDDDPEKLWCICREPHNDRFMIRCDACEDWFHGNCVGVNRKQGRELEKTGKEWVCPNCPKGKKALLKGRVPVELEHVKEEKMEQNVQTDIVKIENLTSEVAVKTEENTSSKIQTLAESQIPKSPDEKRIIKTQGPLKPQSDRPSYAPFAQKCLMCKRPSRPSSIFCGSECILQHANESLRLIGKDKAQGDKCQRIEHETKESPQSKSPRVDVVERSTGKMLTGRYAPTATGLHAFLKSNPTYQVVRASGSNTPLKPICDKKFYGQKPKMIKLISAQPMPVEPSTEGLKGKGGLNRSLSTEKRDGKRPVDVVQTKIKQGGPEAKSKPPDSKIKLLVIHSQQSKTAPPQRPGPITLSKTRPSIESKPKSPGDSMKPKATGAQDVKVKQTIEIRLKQNTDPKSKPVLELKQKQTVDTAKRKPSIDSKSTPTTPPAHQQTQSGTDANRSNVQKSLSELLTARVQEAEDIELSQNEIKKISADIEDELFKLFGDTGAKYKAKYRSLQFNIRDKRNHGLFRKILRGKIAPAKLVRMTPEELASKELAMWREREAKHQLEMIKRDQEEQQHIPIIKKTHKGEIEIDDHDMVFSEKPRAKAEASVPEATVAKVIEDTTEEHRSHLFDLNCKICTGKIVPMPETETPPKTARVAKNISMESKSPYEDDSDENVSSAKPTETKDKTEEEQPKKEDHKKERDQTKKEKDQPKKEKDQSKKVKKEKEPCKEKDSGEAQKSDKSEKRKKDDKKKDASGIKKQKNKDKHVKFGETKEKKIGDKNDKSKEGVAKKKKVRIIKSPVITQEISDGEPSSTVTIGSPDSAAPSQSDDPKALPSVWKGFIMMQDVAKFVTNAYKVSGPTDFLAQDIPDTISVCGRITPHTVWDYLSKVKHSGNKEFLVIRFCPANEEEKVSYLSFYTYLSSRNRFGVVGNTSNMIKDFYILPLGAESSVPATLLPFDGPGLEETRSHMLLGIVIRHKGKRKAGGDSEGTKSKKRNVGDVADTSNDGSEKVKSDDIDLPYEPSYTPPLDALPKKGLSADQSLPYEPSFTPPLEKLPKKTLAGDDSPYSPGRCIADDDDDKPYDPEEAEEAVKVSKKIIPGLLSGSVSSQSVSELIDQISMSSNPTEITTTVLASIATSTNLEQQRKLLIELTQKVEEQKRQLEMQKQQIANKVTAQVMGAIAPFGVALPSTSALASFGMQTPSIINLPLPSSTSKESSAIPGLDYKPKADDEAYSPSFTPPLESSSSKNMESGPVTSSIASSTTTSMASMANIKLPDTSNISLPPNLQEILESIKKQGAAAEKSNSSQATSSFITTVTKEEIAQTGSVTATPPINVMLEDPIVKKFSSAEVVDEEDDDDDGKIKSANEQTAEAYTPPPPPFVDDVNKDAKAEELTKSPPPQKQSDPRLKGKTVQQDPRKKASIEKKSTGGELSSLTASELMAKALLQFEGMPPPISNTTVRKADTKGGKGLKGANKGSINAAVDSDSATTATTTAAPLPPKFIPIEGSLEPPPPGLEDPPDTIASVGGGAPIPSTNLPTNNLVQAPIVSYPIPSTPYVPPGPAPFAPPPPGFGPPQQIFPAYQSTFTPAPPLGFWPADRGPPSQEWRGSGGTRFRGGRNRGGRWEGGRGGWRSEGSFPSSGSDWNTFRDKDDRKDWQPRDRDDRERDRDDRYDREYRDRDRDRRDERRDRDDRDRHRESRSRSSPDRDRDRDRDKDRDRSRSRHRD